MSISSLWAVRSVLYIRGRDTGASLEYLYSLMATGDPSLASALTGQQGRYVPTRYQWWIWSNIYTIGLLWFLSPRVFRGMRYVLCAWLYGYVQLILCICAGWFLSFVSLFLVWLEHEVVVLQATQWAANDSEWLIIIAASLVVARSPTTDDGAV